MINIFYQINKELASWMAIWRFLRSLGRDGLSFSQQDIGRAKSSKNQQVKKWEFKTTRRRSPVMGSSKQSTLQFR